MYLMIIHTKIKSFNYILLKIVCYIENNAYLCNVIRIKKSITKKLSKMKTNKEIKAELNSIECMPIFEINLSDYIETLEEDEYTSCYINYDEQTNMLQYGGYSNGGFICRSEIEYDKYFSLDENLQSLLELFIKNSINEYQDEN